MVDPRVIPKRAIFCDFGGVIYRQPDPQQVARWLHRIGVRNPGALLLMTTSPRESQLVLDIMTGRVPEQTLWDQMAKSWQVHPHLMRLLRRSGYNRKRLDRRLLEFLDALRPRCRTAVLTNAGTDFRDTFCRIFTLDRYVEQVIISAEEGVAKPFPEIFHLAAQRMGVSPADALFIDDLAENVAGAQEAGMTAFVYQNSKHTIQQIQAWLDR